MHLNINIRHNKQAIFSRHKILTEFGLNIIKAADNLRQLYHYVNSLSEISSLIALEYIIDVSKPHPECHFLFACLRFYIPVNSYDHVEKVSFFLSKLN